MSKIVTFHYTLKNNKGETLDSSRPTEPLSYMEGSSQIIPGLEKELAGLKAGDKKVVNVPAAEAYGPRNEQMLVRVPREKLPSKEVKIGDFFRGGAEEHSPMFQVTAVDDKEVTLDGNHPLAGQDLVFDVELTDVREATLEEITHGHAHGEHGHSH